VLEFLKLKLTQFWNILIGKDENWDGVVDIKDDLIKAKKKVNNESKSA